MEYALADRRAQFRIAAENLAKMALLRRLLTSYPDGRVLIIGRSHTIASSSSPSRATRIRSWSSVNLKVLRVLFLAFSELRRSDVQTDGPRKSHLPRVEREELRGT